MSLDVRRSSIRFYPNSKRVITRFFDLGNDSRKKNIIKNILSLSTVECNFQLNQVLREFSNRHRNITKVFKNHFEKVQDIVASLDIDVKALPREKKLLIGAFFTNEYSLESTAFFNPSIVEDPYQGNLSKGEKRVILSFRATGEGHISSIAFRNGILSENQSTKP